MSVLVNVLPIVLMFGLYAALVKLAAFLYRRTQLSWKHALIFAVLALIVGIVGALTNHLVGRVLPVPLAVVVGLVVQLGLGGWYFTGRATTAIGEPLTFKGGALLVAIAYGFIFTLGVVAAIAVPALVHGNQPSLKKHIPSD